jgi:hypothetical protein
MNFITQIAFKYFKSDENFLIEEVEHDTTEIVNKHGDYLLISFEESVHNLEVYYKVAGSKVSFSQHIGVNQLEYYLSWFRLVSLNVLVTRLAS